MCKGFFVSLAAFHKQEKCLSVGRQAKFVGRLWTLSQAFKKGWGTAIKQEEKNVEKIA